MHWVGLSELADSVRESVEARLERLTEGQSDLIDIRIAGKPSRHHRHGGQEVRITCQARGREIVAARTCDELEIALVEAMTAFEGEVHKLRDKRRDRRRGRGSEPPVPEEA